MSDDRRLRHAPRFTGAVALQVLGVVPWLVLGLIGAALLITGRRVVFGIEIGPRDGWLARLLGLLYCVVSGYFAYRAILGQLQVETVIFTYVAAVASILVALSRRRKARAGRVER